MTGEHSTAPRGYPPLMNRTNGQGEAALVAEGVEFDADDATLLREINETGSVARASSNLGRSRARQLSRIETLESAFGDLVERRRGGSGGGGSRLTENAGALLRRYDRLQTALTATATVPETVLNGTVTAVLGELADVETEIGTVRGLHPDVTAGDDVQVRIGADAVTLQDPADSPGPDATSARNRYQGTVTAVEHGETVLEVTVAVSDVPFRALVTDESADRLGLDAGCPVVLTWKATATRLALR